MTRERFKEIRMAALESLKADVESYRRNPLLKPVLRDELERRYQAILQKQAEWERGGFWSEENEKKFIEVYKRLN